MRKDLDIMPNSRIAPTTLRALLAASLVLSGPSAGAALVSPALAFADENSAQEHSESETSATAPAEDAPADSADPAPTEDASAETATVPAEDASAGATAPAAATSAPAEDAEPTSEADASVGTVALVHNGERTAYDSLVEAARAAQDGDAIEVSGTLSISEPVAVDAGRSITLRATADTTVTRAEQFPQEGGKAAGMFRLSDGASLTLEAADPATGKLVIDSERTDSNDAVVTLRGQSTFTMRAGTTIEGAQCSWKPWGAVYVREGTFVLDGGEIRNGFAMRNAAVAVERGSTFEMRAGTITGNRTSYSESIVWTKGVVRMSGGSIAGNSSNVSSDGVVHVLVGGELSFTGGTIGNNNPNNTFGVRVDARGSLELGGRARFEGTDRVSLAQGAALSFASAPEAHTTDDPIEVVLAGEWPAGGVVATASSPEVARAALERLSVRYAGTPEKTASVGLDAADQRRITLASADVAALFDLLDNPFADNLGLQLRDELTGPDALDRLRTAVEEHFAGVETPEKRVRLQQIEDIERHAAYLDAHRDELADTVRELSQLGDPWAEAQRTQQGYQFDNLDATGLYLKPGQVNEIVVYVDADDPSKLSVAWRQVGVTDTNNYPSLNLGQKSGLVNGANRITVDLTGKTYGSMLYLRNDSTENAARVRIEAADAAAVAMGAAGDGAEAASTDGAAGTGGAGASGGTEAGGSPALGTSLGEHPFYEHDPAHPERFWTFVQDIRAHAARAQAGQVADMTLIQMGDRGSAQFAVSATAMAKAYSGISSEAEAIAYIEKSNTAIQNRLEFYWAFDGFDPAEASGPNAITTARVHTAFTRTVSSPSTMYAYGRYFHMPESTAASFLSGDDMYGWGMSHEYGHMLDNNVIAVAEETNNLYSIAGSRHGGIEASRAAGTAFNPSAYYHVNAMNATKRRDAELAQMAADPNYVPDWMNDNVWGTYIWTHVTTWWNGLHFFDDWDYAGYDFSASPYTEEIAADVETYGAYGATLRILRGNPAAVKTIEDLASNATTGVKYNRMAVAFTMGTGYNFAEYLYELGERDLAPEVLEWCAQYPSMPRKVKYFSLNTDAQIINGAKTYEEIVGADGTVEPELTVEIVGSALRVTASMPSDGLTRATTAWELYRDGQLVGFSRDGVFELTGDVGDGDPASFSVVAYDVRLNPHTALAGGDAGEEPGGGEEGGGSEGEEPGDGSGDGEVTPPEGGGQEPGDGSGDGDGGDQKPSGDGDEGGSGEDSGNGEQPPAGEDGEDSGDGNGSNGEGPGSDNPGNGSSDGNQTTPPQGDSDSGESAGEGGNRPGASADADISRAEEDGGKLAATGDALSLPMMVAAAGSALAFAGAAIAARIRRKRD
ncbi:M60 family metallopeptidase [Enorma massiliensis]|uniref:M60 family metallopeptidase n=1 Tax=Enorma massiliensis TaxID=1472761 RepID=UPI000314C2D8|nr:M60 family metallopeptidase [Enorma massiliensis]